MALHLQLVAFGLRVKFCVFSSTNLLAVRMDPSSSPGIHPKLEDRAIVKIPGFSRDLVSAFGAHISP